MKLKLELLFSLMSCKSEIIITNIDLDSDKDYAIINFIDSHKLSGVIPFPKDKLSTLLTKIVETPANGKELKKPLPDCLIMKDRKPTISEDRLPLKKEESPMVEEGIQEATKNVMSGKSDLEKACFDSLGKKPRRVRCPLTDKLITQEEYHQNKKNGKYKDIK